MQQRSFIEKVWDFFCSLKLTIFILIALAVTSIIGTIIPQAPGVPPQYLASLSPFKQEIYFRLGFFNMYHSLWFLGLLGVFATNLIACSIKRIPRAWKLVNEPMSVPVDGFYGTLANSEQFTSRQQPAEIRDALVPFIASSFTPPPGAALLLGPPWGLRDAPLHRYHLYWGHCWHCLWLQGLHDHSRRGGRCYGLHA
jgi:cytochrome c biogenesis protein